MPFIEKDAISMSEKKETYTGDGTVWIVCCDINEKI
jgi:hypothetical protein